MDADFIFLSHRLNVLDLTPGDSGCHIARLLCLGDAPWCACVAWLCWGQQSVLGCSYLWSFRFQCSSNYSDHCCRLDCSKYRCCRKAFRNRAGLHPMLQGYADHNACVLYRVLELRADSLAIGIKDFNRICGVHVQAEGDMKMVLCVFGLPDQCAGDRGASAWGALALSHFRSLPDQAA